MEKMKESSFKARSDLRWHKKFELQVSGKWKNIYCILVLILVHFLSAHC